jgi:hypothetical protein
MPLPKFSGQQIAQLSGWVASYITEQRALFLKNARSISPEDCKGLRAFFPDDILNSVLVVQGRATEPSFYPQLRKMGILNAPAFTEMAGVTFQDVVVHVDPLTPALLFHELVHAVQYRYLGIGKFAEYYVRGFLTGGSYEQIPVEKQAYELEGKFTANPGVPFSVAADVERRIHSKAL